jgi:hypothetical protein
MVSTTEDRPTEVDREIEQLAKLGPGEAQETRMTEAGLMTISSAGRVMTYHTATGEPTPCNRNMLLSHLRKRLPDGRPAYTLDDPGFRPRLGNVKCMLHPDVRRPEYDDYGFPVCTSAHLRNVYQMRRHMKHRHGDVFDAIEHMEQERRRDEERQFQRELLGKAKESSALAAPQQVTMSNETGDAPGATSAASTVEYEIKYGEPVVGKPALDSAEVYGGEFTRPKEWPPKIITPPYKCTWPGCSWEAKKTLKHPRAGLIAHMKLHGV